MQASTERPRFRQDLVAEPIEDGASRFIDVMDPDSGTLFRFFEVEYALACAMDGQRDAGGIVKWADEELGLKTSVKEVGTVIATLGDLGYLERGAEAAAAAAAPTKRPTPAGGINLEKGVVHGTARPATPTPPVELGQAGTQPTRKEELPRAPELELGAPGPAAAGAARAGGKAADIALGAPGRSPNVDVDLAADVPLSPAAVKEAVRQSQVMKAVDVPPELAAELEKPAAKASVPATKAEAKPAAKAEAPAAKAEAKPAAKAEAKAAAKAEAKPAAKEASPPEAAAERHPRADSKVPVAPARGVSPVLIALLVLAILAAGGYALWKFVINKQPATESNVKVVEPPPQPEPPPPPPAETAKLAAAQPAAVEVKPSAAGKLASIVAADTAVKEGDPIARLDGYKPSEAQVASAEKALARAKDAVAAAEHDRDAAQTAGNKNGVASAEKKIEAAQKSVTEQEAKLAAANASLDKFVIKAPLAGTVSPVAKAKAKVSPTDVIATLTPEPTLTATFTSAGSVAAGTHVLLAIANSDQKLACTVAESGGDGAKIACAKDAAPEGTEVTYAGVDPNAAAPSTDESAPGEVPPADDPNAGSDGAPGPDEAQPEDTQPDEGADDTGDAKPEKKAEKKVPARRPRPRPRPRPTPKAEPEAAAADKPAPGSGSAEKPAAGSDKPAEPAAPAPAPAPGSGSAML